MEQAYATAVVLLILVVGINALSAFAARKLGEKDKRDEYFDIKNVNLYYGDFHALKNINMSIQEKNYSLYRIQRMRENPPF